MLEAMSILGRKKVGEYELCEVLGKGTFATVRRAVRTTTNKEYAVKCLEKSKIEEQHMTKVIITTLSVDEQSLLPTNHEQCIPLANQKRDITDETNGAP